MRRSMALAFALAMSLISAVQAQTTWPTKPIRIIVGFAAGGSTDVTARIIGQALSERLGQTVVIENRAGAGGNIGAEAAAKADPDGYTLLMATSSTFAANPALYKSLPFDVQADFAPITVTAFIPNLMVVNPAVPASNLKDFIAYTKVNPGKLNYGSAGNGTSQHISGALFAREQGLRHCEMDTPGQFYVQRNLRRWAQVSGEKLGLIGFALARFHRRQWNRRDEIPVLFAQNRNGFA